MRSARYKVLQASADDPDLATGNVFIGDSLTLTRKVQESTKARISLCEGDTRDYNWHGGFFLSTHVEPNSEQSFVWLVRPGRNFCFFQSLLVLSDFSLRQDHCLGDTTSTYELH